MLFSSPVRMQHKLQLLFGLSVGLLWGCSGSGSSGGSQGPGGLPSSFQLVGISVRTDEVWRINRPIELEFSRPVDFESVGTSTIQIMSAGNLNANGSFSQKLIDTDADGIAETVDPTVIIWQPACPLLGDFSDAGLRPGGVDYQLVVVGEDRSAFNPIRSISGEALRVTQLRNFQTPVSMDAAVIFLDLASGSPLPVLRAATSTVTSGVSFIEIGSDPGVESRIYLERGLGGGVNTINPGSLAPASLPLNLHADESTSVEFVLFFNQPVNPSSANISPARLGVEYLVVTGNVGNTVDTWVPVETEVELVSNCAGPGAQIRVRPLGGLPAGTMVRAVVRAGFEGLVGNTDSGTSTLDRFAVAPSQVLDHTSLTDPSAGADGVLENFDLAGEMDGSLEDTGVLLTEDLGDNSFVLDVPAAWGGGSLTSTFGFDGTGGVGGNFDWFVDSGAVETFDTSSQSITSGMGGSGLVQFTTGGVVNVRDFTITVGSTLRVIGPNPLEINATGTVRIDGVLDISGFDVPILFGTNAGHIPVLGGAGVAGGGDGGAGSSVTDNSTPRGDRGRGAFGSFGGGGGQGGESGSGLPIAGISPNNRRPGGGAGGAFNVAQNDSSASRTFNIGAANNGSISQGMVARVGTNGNALSVGAVSGTTPAMGGQPGVGPFVDGDPNNNFFGRRADVIFSIPADLAAPVASQATRILTGELSAMHAGAGGGGGGDALTGEFFPTPNWTPGSDERGGGGGGGGGALRIRALGPIIMTGLGSQIRCRGGRGGTGENSVFFDQVGGIGGSGSGGHVVLESGAFISFVNADIADQHLFIDARGGRENRGRGADGSAQNNPIPFGIGDGGQGGPGLIQLHTPNSSVAPDEGLDLANPLASRISLPQGTLNQLDAGDASALNEITRPAGLQMIPSFSALSSARTDWVDIGSVDALGTGGLSLVQFLFDGIDAADGSVLTSGGMVDELTALLGPAALDNVTARIVGANRLVLSGAALAQMVASSGPLGDDIYLRTPALLRNCLLRMTPGVGAPVAYNVEDASYADAGTVLTLDLQGSQDLSSFAGLGTPPTYTLVPRFFSVSTDGNTNALPDGSSLKFSFDMTGRDVSGMPDEANILFEKETDISLINGFLQSDFNPDQNGSVRFFRLNFEFNLDADGGGLNNLKRPISLDFVRLPFSY